MHSPIARWPVLLLAAAALASPARAQMVSARMHAAYGTNLLFSPGTDLRSSPGRTGHVGVQASIGRPGGRVAFVPALRMGQHAFRTRMAYRVHFTTVRSQFDLDLAVGLRQMSGTVWHIGGFIGRATKVTNRIEQRSDDRSFPRYPLTTLSDRLYDRDQFGALLGLQVPLDERHRWSLDLMLRYHFTPLVNADQHVALVHRPPQLVTSTVTRPATLTVGIGFRFAGPDPAPAKAMD
ncbi:MAG: hypothetical protein RBT71_03590 [Flavobacteriales bacterium]|jgi:hypothetical protein|nr:hypothetical protein [Flavobacteriales bacterium]